jgi:CheY-like chemotaxis protein
MKTKVIDHSKIINIVFADDDEDDRNFLINALVESHIPHSIETVTGGSQLMDYLVKKGQYKNVTEPDVIILDLNMPVIDGFSVLKKIKSDKSLKHIPVYILSTSGAQSDIEKSKALGASGYFKKNNKLRDWTETVQDIIYDLLTARKN